MLKIFHLCCLTVIIGCAAGPQDAGATRLQQAKPDSSASQGVSTLSLKALPSESGKVVLSLDYLISATQSQGPRIAEVLVEHSSGLAFDSAEAGDAAKAAGKEVVVQAKDATHTRIVVYSSSNTASIGSGTLARVKFARTAGGAATARILTEKPFFAPQEAQHGLQVSDPISL